MYKANRINGKVINIERLSDGSCFPINMENRDYVLFLKWQDEQADEDKLDISDEEAEVVTPLPSLEERIASLEAVISTLTNS